jgi:hypothetical protein
MRELLMPSKRSSRLSDALDEPISKTGGSKIGEGVGVSVIRELGCSRGRCSGEPSHLEEPELELSRRSWSWAEASLIGKLRSELSGELASLLTRDRRASESTGRSRRNFGEVAAGERSKESDKLPVKELESVRVEKIGEPLPSSRIVEKGECFGYETVVRGLLGRGADWGEASLILRAWLCTLLMPRE